MRVSRRKAGAVGRAGNHCKHALLTPNDGSGAMKGNTSASTLLIACNLFDKVDDATPEFCVFEPHLKALVRASPSEVARKSDT